jgi:hypothetical protein
MRSPESWSKRAVIAGWAMVASACASNPSRPIAIVPGGDLPAAQGRAILQTSCTACHDLAEVTKFRGYYTKDQWQDVVMTMMGYGAKVKEEDVRVLIDYLTQSLGRK